MKRVVIYARVSTDEQAKYGYSLSTQLAACRQYAQTHGFTTVAELDDDCSGTIPIIARPKGRDLYDLIERDSIDGVILYTHDRTARDERVIEYLLFKSHLYDKGIELHYSDDGLDPYTLEGNLVGYIKAHEAASERRKIVERSNRGKVEKARRGNWVGNNHPYGYRVIGKGRDAHLEIDEEAAKVVERAFAMYLGLDGYKYYTMLGIAKILTAEKVPLHGRAYKNAKGWGQESVRYILMNPAYIGEFRYKDVIIHLPDLAIIDREVWEAAQERREKNAQQARRNGQHDFLLGGGYIKCACGQGMIARVVYDHRTGKPYFYYSCTTVARRHIYSCEERYLRADAVDAKVWEWLYGLLSDEDNLEQGIRRLAERSEVELSPKRKRLENVCKLIADATRRINNLSIALDEAEVEEAVNALRAQLKNVGGELKSLKEERCRLEAEIQQGSLRLEEIEAIRKTAAEIREELTDHVDFQKKRYLVDKLDVQVKLARDEEKRRCLDVSCVLVIEPERLFIESQ